VGAHEGVSSTRSRLARTAAASAACSAVARNTCSNHSSISASVTGLPSGQVTSTDCSSAAEFMGIGGAPTSSGGSTGLSQKNPSQPAVAQSSATSTSSGVRGLVDQCSGLRPWANSAALVCESPSLGRRRSSPSCRRRSSDSCPARRRRLSARTSEWTNLRGVSVIPGELAMPPWCGPHQSTCFGGRPTADFGTAREGGEPRIPSRAARSRPRQPVTVTGLAGRDGMKWDVQGRPCDRCGVRPDLEPLGFSVSSGNPGLSG
jgi:hypothetical protein